MGNGPKGVTPTSSASRIGALIDCASAAFGCGGSDSATCPAKLFNRAPRTSPVSTQPPRILSICLACAFQDGLPSRHCLVPAQDDIHIERVKLDTAAASACLFGSDDRRCRTDEWVEAI